MTPNIFKLFLKSIKIKTTYPSIVSDCVFNKKKYRLNMKVDIHILLISIRSLIDNAGSFKLAKTFRFIFNFFIRIFLFKVLT